MSRKITQAVCNAFEAGKAFSQSNSAVIVTDDTITMTLHGNAIAKRDIKSGKTSVSNGGWTSNTTKERLNGLRNVQVTQRNWVWYLNGDEWNGQWKEI